MKSKVLALILLVLTLACNKDDSTNEPANNASEFEDIRVSFNEVSTQEINSYTNLLQATVSISNKYQISTFGQIGTDGFATGIDKMYIYDAIENVESVILLDDNNEPAFIYGVDLVTGLKSNGITEFERIDTNSFYLRLYDYDWVNRLGTLLFETIITESGGAFNSSPTFDISDNSASKKSISKEKGKSFKTPILRLEQQTKKTSLEQLNSKDLIEGWINDLTDFRNNQIPKFLDTAQDVGLVTAIGAGAAVLVGSAGAAPLFIGGVALTATAAALEFIISDDFSNFIDQVRTDFSDLREDLNTSVSGIVETIEGYGEAASTFLNENLSGLSFSDILASIEEENLFIDNQDLDDLPDSNGVLQIGLSWSNGGTDIDLYVTDPTGTTIYYVNPSSSSGGFLDRDDTDGFGPENIFWNGNYPDGTYSVSVNYYGCDFETCPSTNYTVKISDGLGFLATFTGSLNSEGATINVTSFEVSNGQITTSM
jgi:hypothetical protein